MHGRRQRPHIRDLIAAGTLPVGTELYHRGRLAAGRVVALVVQDGIRVRGYIYPTPTAAARSVTGKPVDGWLFWRVTKTNEPLDRLRPPPPAWSRQTSP